MEYFKKRLEEELKELQERHDKLNKFISIPLTELVEKVGDVQARLLIEQRAVMEHYIVILENRMDNLN